MRPVVDALEFSRSNLTEQLNKKSHPKSKRSEDAWLLPLIKKITDERPTYGYRRVTALLRLKTTEPVNHKRVYRLMKENGLLLQKYGRKKTQTHDGTVIILKSNTRWCSDSFSIQCFNGERVHVASTIGIDGAAIRDLMVDSLEACFGKVKVLPYRVQWLSDNGPCYTSHETVEFGRMIGFDIRTTPAYSPESNGMAEAFVKTFKRDYAWFGDLKDAQTVMGQLAAWFEDYNEKAPHKGLKMKSPRQFRRELMAG